jgi:cytosine/adenosine deaminase-related metal-dependent hydrolase
MSQSIFLQNGSVIVHDEHDHIHVLDNCDILISDGIIARVGSDLCPPTDVEVLDCSNKIISPGFVNTHHHLWQTQLKGYGVDHCWLEYFSDGKHHLDNKSQWLTYQTSFNPSTTRLKTPTGAS